MPTTAESTAAAASTSDASAEHCTVSVECRSLLAATERYEETRSAPTRIAACRAAGDALRATHACDLFSVDGVAVGWLPSAAVDPPPPGTSEREVACEIQVARAISEEAMGHGQGTTDEEAIGAGARAACTALGETECSLARGFYAQVRARRTSASTRMTGGVAVTTMNIDADLALWRVVVDEGRGTSLRSGAEACAMAYRTACGDDGCGERDRIVAVDGISVTP